jgi:glycosyltransferase involved in cell wall biosynthesis
MKIDLVMPVHNEEFTIEETLAEWFSYAEDHKIDLRIITSEDGSKDETKKVLQKISLNANLLVLSEEMRKGYSKAVVDGIKLSDGDITCIVDSDGQCDPNDLSKFLKELESFPNSIITGIRSPRNDSIVRKIMSMTFKVFYVLLFRIHLSDPSCPYVMGKTKQVKRLMSNPILEQGYWWEFHARRKSEKIDVREIRINHRQREHGNSRVYSVKSILRISIRHLLGLFRLKSLLSNKSKEVL